MKNKQRNIFFSVLILLTLINLNLKINHVSAAMTKSDAIASVPNGLDITQYFEHGTSSNAKFKTNSATTVSGNNQIMDLASGANSVGAYWSKESAKNYLKVDEDQTISAWLYFGDGSGSDQLTNGEGMAFVLQNDTNGINALGAGFEGLGVYGTDYGTMQRDTIDVGELIKTYTYPKTYTAQSIASTAIQNSLALEFDTELDNTSKEDILSKQIGSKYTSNLGFTTNKDYSLNNFDTTSTNLVIPSDYPDKDEARFGMGGGYGHIAVTYPGMSDSYQKLSTGFSTFGSAFSMIHTKASQSANLVDDIDSSNRAIYWHHLTIHWEPNDDGTATLSYSFNDINPNDNTANYNYGSSNNFVRVDNSVKVDYKKLFGDTDKILWGFTGSNSTSDDVADKMVAFESIPAMLYIETASNIVDHTLNDRTIDKDSSTASKTIGAGDDLSINYDLDYDSGRDSWKKVNPVLNLPSNFTVKSDDNNNIGTITYKDNNGKTVKTENISASDLNGTKITIPTLDSAGTGLLGDADSGLPTHITFTVNGTSVNNTDKDVTVKPVASIFTGQNEISEASTPEFIIRYKKTHKLQLTPESKTIDLLFQGDGGLTLSTILKYDNGDDFLTSPEGSIFYTITVNGKKYTAAKTSDGSASLSNDFDIKNDLINNDSEFWNIFKLNSTQKITITATDQDGITSNTATFTVNVIPNKSLKVSADSLSFGTIQALGNSDTLKRQNNLNLHVKSNNTVWHLFAKASILENSDDDSFNGFIYYNSTKNDLNSGYINIANHNDTSDYNDTISDDWSNNEGILLYNDGVNQTGTYSGEITWLAQDTI